MLTESSEKQDYDLKQDKLGKASLIYCFIKQRNQQQWNLTNRKQDEVDVP